MAAQARGQTTQATARCEHVLHFSAWLSCARAKTLQQRTRSIPRPAARSRRSSFAADAMSVTRDFGCSSTRMFSSLWGLRRPHAGVFSIRISALLRGLWMFVLVRVVGVRGYDGRILDADRCEKWRPRRAEKQRKRRLDVSTCFIFLRGCRARSHARLFRRSDAEVWSAR